LVNDYIAAMVQTVAEVTMDMGYTPEEHEAIMIQYALLLKGVSEPTAYYRLAQLGYSLKEGTGEWDTGREANSLPDLRQYRPGLVEAFTTYLRTFLPTLGTHMDADRVEAIVSEVDYHLNAPDGADMDSVLDMLDQMQMTSE
jgi:hypothetical protein